VQGLERSFIAPPGERWASAHAASAALLPDGTIVASWFAGSREGAPDAAIWFSRCTAAGWEPARVIADSPGQADGNSVLWLDGAGALRIWYVTMQARGWRTCIVRERRSQDGGRTWSADRLVRGEWGWMVRNEPLALVGRLLMPMYDERDWSAFVLVSEDAGETWSESGRVRANVGVIQPALAPLSDGRLLMFLRSTGGAVYRALSSDGGLTWSAPEATALPNPNSAVELIRLRSGALLTVYNPTAAGRSRLRVALSFDGGETWTADRDLEVGTAECSYPTALQARDGLVHVLYTYRRETIAHATLSEAWARGE
jgi:predicted neuraminidase